MELDESCAHYVRNVLRLNKAGELILFNGEGGEYAAVLALVSRKSVVVEIGEWRGVDRESSLKINLGLGIARGERMDFAIQKAVELGVNTVVPLVTDRSVVRLKGDRSVHRQFHWQKIVQHACEQCGRTRLPDVQTPQSLAHWAPDLEGLKLILDPDADRSLQGLSPETNEVSILSGPEGGFTRQEKTIATDAGFKSVCLGPRILRAETAVLTAIGIVQACWGDLS